MKLIWRRAALADLGGAVLYIATDKPGAAVEVLRRIRQAQDLLQQWPEIGRPAGSMERRILRVDRTPYLIVYELRGERLIITGIVHGRRNRR
ncbi:MAG: type II toxin-antitoxin system RelE/ParE family toxin [Terricaulis sp.]